MSARRPEESIAEYHTRLKEEKQKLDERIRGRVVSPGTRENRGVMREIKTRSKGYSQRDKYAAKRIAERRRIKRLKK